jgi:hypothetical protein
MISLRSRVGTEAIHDYSELNRNLLKTWKAERHELKMRRREAIPLTFKFSEAARAGLPIGLRQEFVFLLEPAEKVNGSPFAMCVAAVITLKAVVLGIGFCVSRRKTRGFRKVG